MCVAYFQIFWCRKRGLFGCDLRPPQHRTCWWSIKWAFLKCFPTFSRFSSHRGEKTENIMAWSNQTATFNCILIDNTSVPTQTMTFSLTSVCMLFLYISLQSIFQLIYLIYIFMIEKERCEAKRKKALSNRTTMRFISSSSSSSLRLFSRFHSSSQVSPNSLWL